MLQSRDIAMRCISKIGMKYRNSAGEISDRVIEILSATGEGKSERWVAYCNLRHKIRTFIPDSALAFYDPETGALIERNEVIRSREHATPKNGSPPKLNLPGITARTLLFFDVETTGLGRHDRIVSFGGVKLYLEPPGELRTLHLIFNPERRCSAAATQIYGWGNATLKYQDPIGGYITPFRAWMAEAELIVAHNIDFDLRFLNNAFNEIGERPLSQSIFCTMRALRQQRGEFTALDDLAQHLGFAPRGSHCALQDAWYCMQTYLWLHELPWRLNFFAAADNGPANFRAPPIKRARGRLRKAHSLSEENPETSGSPARSPNDGLGRLLLNLPETEAFDRTASAR